MHWRAVVVALVMLNGVEFFKLVDNCEVSGQEAVMLLGKIVRVGGCGGRFESLLE